MGLLGSNGNFRPSLDSNPIHRNRTMPDAFSRHNRISSLYKNVLIIPIKSLLRLKKKSQPKDLPTNAPFRVPSRPEKRGMILYFSPHSFIRTLSDYSIAVRVRRILVNYPLSRSLSYSSGTWKRKSHTQGLQTKRVFGGLLWALTRGLAHQLH